MRLVFATNNNHKVREISALLDQRFSLSGLPETGITGEIPEDGATLEENALFKARYVHIRTGLDVFADDTGLEVDALDGRPGVHSARYAGPGKNSEDNIARLLSEMEGRNDRTARFRTVIALILEGKEYLFEGKVEGAITWVRKGTNGFGYDPVFMPEGYTRTFAELSLGEKNLISHRARAMQQLVSFLNNLREEQNRSDG